MAHDLAEFDNPLTDINNAHARAAILKRLYREHQNRVADCVNQWAKLRATHGGGEPA